MKLSSICKFTAAAAISILGAACKTHSSPGDAARILRTERFMCDRENVRIVTNDGDVILKRGDTSPRIFPRTKQVTWYGEEGGLSTMDTWMMVQDTAYILVIRESSGGAGKVIFFRN
ncbi:MAG: hypothetical protein ACKVS6_04745 [Planctomycetota bacterium]